MLCYARYHFQNREQLNQIENNIQNPKHKILQFFRKLIFFVNISCIYMSNCQILLAQKMVTQIWGDLV